MAVQISKRMKIIFIILAGVIIAGFAYAYQKILGGKAINLPENKFLVGEKNTITVTSKEET